ncbi:hypothetical protein [Pseudomonas sp. G5(2012)]|jgi:hypothetical protein|uniref:hypothetical protein n=1 Tax=Pseudomonas sp. G5(2012) TaxID=1268068 RepID=UPI0005B5014D|nr:hypothetical protein [Pseudomonas sp. G5(2012)]
MNLAVKLIGKGLGSIILAISAASFAAYAMNHFPGWAIALSFLLGVCASIPMVLFFNLFPSSDSPPSKSYVIKDDPNDDWDDHFRHSRDDDRFDD